MLAFFHWHFHPIRMERVQAQLISIVTYSCLVDLQIIMSYVVLLSSNMQHIPLNLY